MGLSRKWPSVVQRTDKSLCTSRGSCPVVGSSNEQEPRSQRECCRECHAEKALPWLAQGRLGEQGIQAKAGGRGEDWLVDLGRRYTQLARAIAELELDGC